MRCLDGGGGCYRFSARFGKGISVKMGQDSAGTWVEPPGACCHHSPEDHHLLVARSGEGVDGEGRQQQKDRNGKGAGS